MESDKQLDLAQKVVLKRAADWIRESEPALLDKKARYGRERMTLGSRLLKCIAFTDVRDAYEVLSKEEARRTLERDTALCAGICSLQTLHGLACSLDDDECEDEAAVARDADHRSYLLAPLLHCLKTHLANASAPTYSAFVRRFFELVCHYGASVSIPTNYCEHYHEAILAAFLWSNVAFICRPAQGGPLVLAAENLFRGGMSVMQLAASNGIALTLEQAEVALDERMEAWRAFLEEGGTLMLVPLR